MSKITGSAKPVSILVLNPAVDMTYEIDQLQADQKVHASATRFDPGGNGINVGRGLKRLAVHAHSFCVVGGEIGSFLEQLLHRHIDTVSIEHVDEETRINSTIIEHKKPVQYEISGIAPSIPDYKLERLLDAFVANVDKATGSGFGILTGSIQSRFSADFYAQMVARIRHKGGKSIVDAQGDLLRYAVEEQPFLIKPNQFELQQLVGKPLSGIREIAQQARKLQQKGVENICVSLGAEGAIFTHQANSYHAIPPQVEVNSTVGAGDSMVAGLIAGLSRQQSIEDTLRLSVACGVGTVGKQGTQLFTPEELPGLMDKIIIKKLDI